MIRYATLAALLLLAGCRTPEQRSIFQSDAEAGIPEKPAAAAPAAALPPPADPLPAPAAGPLQLSVEQAIVYALGNNRDLAVQRFGPIVTGTFENIERGEFDPQVFASFSTSEEVVSQTDRGTGRQFSVQGQDSESEAGIRQNLPTGTKIEATVTHNRSISNRTPEQYEARMGFRVTQALLRGRGLNVNLASIRQAELDTQISQHELRAYTETVVANTELAYWNLVFADTAMATVEQSLQLAQQQQRDIEQRIEVGTLPRLAAAAPRAEVARREQAVIDARSLLETRRLNLLRLMSPGTDPYGYQLHPETDAKGLAPQAITNLDDRLTLAVTSRPELGEARLRLQQNRLETVVTRDGLRPRLDFFIELGRSGFEGSYSGAFKKIPDWETYDVTAGIELSQFIDRRAAKARDQAAWANREKAEKAIANLENAVELDVRLAVNEVERARMQIAATAATRTLQEASLQAEQQRLEAGAGTTLQVAQAQRDLLESQIDEIGAVITYRQALVRLYLAEGTLLNRRGISVP